MYHEKKIVLARGQALCTTLCRCERSCCEASPWRWYQAASSPVPIPVERPGDCPKRRRRRLPPQRVDCPLGADDTVSTVRR